VENAQAALTVIVGRVVSQADMAITPTQAKSDANRGNRMFTLSDRPIRYRWQRPTRTASAG